MLSQFGVKINPQELTAAEPRGDRRDYCTSSWLGRYEEKEDMIGPAIMREAERMIMLNVIDNQWKDHLLSMDHLKEGIGLRGYGQKDPLIEYKKESFALFQDMMDRIEDETIRYLFFLQVAGPDEMAAATDRRGARFCPSELTKTSRKKKTTTKAKRWPWRRTCAANSARPRRTRCRISRAISSARKKKKWPSCNSSDGGSSRAIRKAGHLAIRKAGRNDPCPCGSGKKYKKCHGA